MVVLNGLKYACETCIKGHRSSACSHTDRALFEIKKKGRPITQCEHCRHLRKTKQVHVKCLCGDRPDTEKNNNARAKLKLPTSATIHLDPNDPTHATITTVSLPTRTKLKPKPKVIGTKTCDCGKTGACDCVSVPADARSTRPTRLSPPHPPSDSDPVTPPSTASTSSCCSSNKSQPPDSRATTNSNDKYTASLLDDLSRVSAVPSSSHHVQHHRTQPFYNSGIGSTSFAWQSGVNLGSCSCGITCACPGCYEHSPSTSMILFTGESCPYSCTTCTECNGFGFTSHMANAFLVPPHTNDNWSQSSNSIVSTTALVPTPATSISGSSSFPSVTATTTNTAAVRSCCGGPCKCSVCNCNKIRDGDESPERIGFAVSGERGGCCTDVNPRIRYQRPAEVTDNMLENKRQKLGMAVTGSISDNSDNLYPVENPPASLSLQSNPTTSQIQSHSIEIPKFNI